jgi:hypothetical protein
MIKSGKPALVLQIASFMSPVVLSRDGSKLSFFAVLREIIRDAKEMRMPLILDLRDNPGGITLFPGMLLSLLTEEDKTYSNVTLGYRISRPIIGIWNHMFKNSIEVSVGSELTTDQSREVFRRAIEKNQTYTQMVSMNQVEADPELGGFDLPIVALISPSCISSCDIMASLLKASRRATLIGQPTNGTGMGMIPTHGSHSMWKDSKGLTYLAIPNFFFGKPSLDPKGRVLQEPVESLNLENIPTMPDVEYTPSASDLLTQNQGWFDTAMKILEKTR